MDVRTCDRWFRLQRRDEDDAQSAVELAAELCRSAGGEWRGLTTIVQERLVGAVMDDPASKLLLMVLTDEVMRIRDDRRAAAAFRALVRRTGVPAGLPAPFRAARAARAAGAAASRVLPGAVMPQVRAQVKFQSRPMILPAEDPALAARLGEIAADGYALNVNLLGEAVLGWGEADKRLVAVMAVLSRPDVDYISVKPSAVCGALPVLDHEATVATVAERLRRSTPWPQPPSRPSS